MSNKLIVIISTAEVEKARTGMMYAVNALLHGWMEDVKIFIFGPAESLILEDIDLQERLQTYHDLGHESIACKYLSDEEGTSSKIEEIGVTVAYVGESISNLIKEGYVPMVW